MSAARSRDLALAGGVALCAVALAAALLASGVRLTQEDGFYYFKIAQHVAAGRGSTFDGLHPTNGYHPLWLVCLVPLFALFRSPEDAMAAATLLQALLLAIGAGLVVLLARTVLSQVASALAGLTLVLLTWRVALSGVEFALVTALLAAVAVLLMRQFTGDQPASVATHALMGLLLALAFLARLDTALLAALVGLELTRRAWGARATAPFVARLAALWLPMVTVGAAYLAVNAALFGHPLPVSGLAKRAWSAYLLRQDPVYQGAGWLAAKAVNLMRPLLSPLGAGMAAVLIGGAGALAVLALRAARARGSALDTCAALLVPLRPLALFAALQPVAYVLVYHGHYSHAPWYYAAQPLLAALLIAALAESQAARFVVRAQPALAAACLLAASFATLQAVGLRRTQAQADGPLYVAARWARDNLAPEARVGTWNAGAIGYLSGRQVVNLDGVVNTVGFLERDQYDLCGYWKRTGITHLVDVFEAREGSTSMAGGSLPVFTFYAGCAQSLELLWSERVPGNPGWPKAFRIRP